MLKLKSKKRGGGGGNSSAARDEEVGTEDRRLQNDLLDAVDCKGGKEGGFVRRRCGTTVLRRQAGALYVLRR